MKYAFMTFSCPELTFDQVLDAASRFEYDGVELRIDSKHAHGIEPESDAATRSRARNAAADAGVAIACVATSCRFADPAEAERHVARAHEAIDLAGDLGAPVIRVFGGQFPDDMSREEAVRQVAAALRELAPHAAARGVTLCLETHDAWCDPRHVAAVMEAATHPNIAVNWDILHPVRTGAATIDESFEILRPYIRHLHVHDGVVDENGRFHLRPIGQGIVDHGRALERLFEIEYDGYISGEWIGWQDPWEVHLPRELKALRALEAPASR